MDLFDAAFLDFWRALNEKNVRYILVGGFATNFMVINATQVM